VPHCVKANWCMEQKSVKCYKIVECKDNVETLSLQVRVRRTTAAAASSVGRLHPTIKSANALSASFSPQTNTSASRVSLTSSQVH